MTQITAYLNVPKNILIYFCKILYISYLSTFLSLKSRDKSGQIKNNLLVINALVNINRDKKCPEIGTKNVPILTLQITVNQTVKNYLSQNVPTFFIQKYIIKHCITYS